MGSRRTLLAGVSVVLALLAGVGVYTYVAGADDRAAGQVRTVEAFVAVRDIPKGTTGATALASGLIAPARALSGSVPRAAVTDASDLDGRVAAADISAKQFITSASFVAPSDAGGSSLAASIGGRDLVAVTVAFDAAQSLAGQIAPGDRVDLVAAREAGSSFLLRNVKILAVGTETAATAGGGSGAPSAAAVATGLVTFEVAPDEALAIVAESRADTLHMLLHSLSGAATATSAVTP